MNSNSRYYKKIDIARFICACFVVLIHMGFDESVALIPCLTRQAVPFFFLTSGFFYSKNISKSGNQKQFIVSYIKLVLLVYAFWTILWLPFIACEAYTNYSDQSVIYVVLVVLRRIFLAGIAPYWYLLVLAEGSALLAMIMCRRRYLLGWILTIIGLILLVNYNLPRSFAAGAPVNKVFYLIFSWDCNVIMSGFPMLFLGCVFARYEEQLSSLKKWPLAAMYCLVIVSAFYVYKRYTSLFGIPVGVIEAVLIFLLCDTSSSCEDAIPTRIGRTLRSASSVIFLTHTIFLKLTGEVLNIWGAVPRFLITLVLAIIMTWLIVRINWKPLNTVFMLR